MLFQLRDGGVEVLDLQRGGAAVGAGFETGRAADGERIRAEFVLDPFALENARGFQAEHAFVEFSRPRNVGDSVTTKGQFDDFEHNEAELCICNRVETQFFSSVNQRASASAP